LKIVATSGYFDPLHVGHLECLELAKQLGDKLIVIVNSDLQAKLKKGKSFMSENDRMKIVSALKCVDEVFLSIDKDKTQCKSLEYLKPNIFAKGGDRLSNEIPESKTCHELGIEIIDGLGDKIRSSSDITGLKEIKRDQLET
jgi:cytidyltransferase-like protein|tara:strand:- start:133 stop:558 length:426 start_codon:yes stop_codon:yes gene_type:complete